MKAIENPFGVIETCLISKRHPARPVDSLQGKGFSASYRPTPVGSAREKVAFRGKLKVENPRGKPFAERITRPLPDSVYFFGH